MTLSKRPSYELPGGYNVPLGWVAFIAGAGGIFVYLLEIIGVLEKLRTIGVLKATTDDTLLVGSIGLAWLIGGYIACFVIPHLHRRVSALETRINNIENKRMDECSPKETER